MPTNTTTEDAKDFVKETIKISVFTPLIYVGILMTAFIAFSINHRKRRLRQLAQIEPLFPENQAANLYALVKQMSVQSGIPDLQKPGPAVLKAALLRRAGEAIRRSMKLKEYEDAFEKLYHEGLIGDDIYKQHEIQSKVQELELQEIVKEAQEIKADWVESFFPVAQEICFNEAMRRRFYAMEDRARELTRQWELESSSSELNLDAKNLKNTTSTESVTSSQQNGKADSRVEDSNVSDADHSSGEDEAETNSNNISAKTLPKAGKKKSKKKKATR